MKEAVETEAEQLRATPVTYTYGEYEVRVHFSGKQTFRQCIQNLAERNMREQQGKRE